MIVEAATGNEIGPELERRIFGPLRLRQTSFDTKPRIAGRHAHGYILVDKPPLRDTSVLSPSWGWTAGAIVSTADDVARFYRALLRGRLLPPELLGTMETTIPTELGFGYGMGLVAPRLPCGLAWGHDGGFPGYRTFAFSSKDGTRQAILLVNLDEDSQSKKVIGAIESALVGAYCG